MKKLRYDGFSILRIIKQIQNNYKKINRTNQYHPINQLHDYFFNFYNSFIQQIMYSDWPVQKEIYRQEPTIVSILKKGGQKVVKKQITLTNNNRNYAKYQLKLMKEIDHPFVVKLLDSQEIKQTKKEKLIVYISFYENLDLQSYLSKHQVDFETKIRMFIDILEGIKELHSRYVIHRDIKLKNIFLDKNCRCVIGDLGIATKSVDSAKSSIGTICLNAPQVYSNVYYNQIVDIWALGIIAYQLFNRKRNGRIPFPFMSPQLMRPIIIRYGDSVDYQSYMNLTRDIQPMDEDLPVQIKQMIKGMLKNDPKERLSWVQFYKAYHLQKWDADYRLCAFMAEYKMIEDTKETLKDYLKFFKDHKEKYFFRLRHVLHHQKVDFFKQKYALLRENLIDIHIAHFKLMRKTLDRYAYISSKKIYKYVLDWKEFVKAVKNEIHPIEHRINYRLRNNKEPQIKTNPKYLSTQYFNDTLKLIDNLLETIEPKDFEDMQQL